MTASLDFTAVQVCSGGSHINIEMTLTVNGNQRSKAVHLITEDLQQPITEEDIESFTKVLLRIIRAQNPNNLRNAVLNKVVNLDV
jgi:hypothetical protein